MAVYMEFGVAAQGIPIGEKGLGRSGKGGHFGQVTSDRSSEA